MRKKKKKKTKQIKYLTRIWLEGCNGNSRASSCLRSPELFSTARLLTKITPISNSILASHSLSLTLKTPNQNPNPNSTRLSATATSTLVFCAILRTPLNPNSSFLIFSAISIILNFSLLIDNV